ncbi:fungal-specific transcription factor domain-containing protein [Hypoxylon sp. NC1633]|nr:fungal-specific transcription factor domain-containing protein [Hypoxylon sp. NC1633]
MLPLLDSATISLMFDDSETQCNATEDDCTDSVVAAPPRHIALNDATRDAAEAEAEESGTMARLSLDFIPDEAMSNIAWDPVPSLYNEAQIIFDGLHYFNERVSGDLISINSHFNPYQVDINDIEHVPRIYASLLVSTATLHRAMQEDVAFARSSAMVRRDQDLFHFRIRALREIKYRISIAELQTSDSTLMCVMCLLLATMQQSAYTDWRIHLEGARRIIQLRGGLKEVLTKSPHLKPLLALFMVIDVMAATTAPSTHKHMAAATSMALRYWEVEANIFQTILAISAPCPEELFQSLILVNYLRSISGKPKLTPRRHTGTRMVLAKIRCFVPAEWAMRMRVFRGWKRTSDGVEFDMPHSQAQSLESPMPSQNRSDARPSSLATINSPGIPEYNIWLSVGVVYRAAILLYTIRTLILDLPESKEFLNRENQTLNFEKLRSETRQTLAGCLAPLFLTMDSARRIGKLVFFPVFVCGMEADPKDYRLQEFITKGLQMLGQTMGTFGPISAIDELKRKWAADAAAPEGTRVTWDDYFRGRPDFIFGF